MQGSINFRQASAKYPALSVQHNRKCGTYNRYTGTPLQPQGVLHKSFYWYPFDTKARSCQSFAFLFYVVEGNKNPTVDRGKEQMLAYSAGSYVY